MSKNLQVENLDRTDPKTGRCGFRAPSRPRSSLRTFDRGTRSDVTRGLWKLFESGEILKYRTECMKIKIPALASGAPSLLTLADPAPWLNECNGDVMPAMRA